MKKKALFILVAFISIGSLLIGYAQANQTPPKARTIDPIVSY